MPIAAAFETFFSAYPLQKPATLPSVSYDEKVGKGKCEQVVGLPDACSITDLQSQLF